jgi:hypothetical protein
LPFFHYTGLQPLPQQLQHPPVTDSPLHQGEQEIVIDRIKIPLDVGVYHPPTSQQYFVDCTDRLRRTASRSKPVRLVLEVRFEDWLDYYPTRLLDDPISHCRNPQGPLAAIWLGNIYPQHRLGVISSCLQIRRKYLEKRCHALALHLFQAHAIDASTASVGFHFLPGPPQYIGPEYAVIECVEPSLPTLLGRQL